MAGLAAAAVTGNLSPRVLLLPLGLLWLIAVTAGTVGIISALAVRYRDLMAVLPLVFQVGVFFSPIGYQSADLPSAVRLLIGLNPLAGVMEMWRWMILPIGPPDWRLVAISAAVTAVLVVGGWFVFTRSEPTMADVV